MIRFNHVKEKAIELRKRGKSLTDLCLMLGISKSTIYCWIKDVIVEDVNVFIKNNKEKIKKSTLVAAWANKTKFNRIHESYRKSAKIIWDKNKDNKSFREFIMGYICEGYKKTKHLISICNSDPIFMTFNKKWFEILNFRNKKIEYNLQIHLDQKEEEIVLFWKDVLGIDKEIKVRQKSNSGNLNKRNWNCKYGVITISIADSYLKTMLDTWIDFYKEELVMSIVPIVMTE